jgi:hypothetical protein
VRPRLLLLSAFAILAIGMSAAAGAMRASLPVEPEVERQSASSPSAAPGAQRPVAGGQRPAPGGQRPVPGGQRPAAGGHQHLPPGHPPLVQAPGTHSPGLVQQRELRRRIAEAIELGRRARSGEQAAKDAVAAQLAHEADPRVREALAMGEPPAGLGQNRGWAPPVLPEPAARADPGEVRAYWVTPDSRGGTYESSVTVDASGRAQVETVYDAENGEHWHVRYPAWAFRDAQGRLVVDARGQAVECLKKPEWGWWSPDSMVIGTDGLIDMIDDKHDPGQGTSGANGSG